MKPLWENVLAGDKVKVKAHNDQPSGTYTVAYTDRDLSRGSDANGIYTTDNGGFYIINGMVEAIVERDGKPYAAVNWRDVRKGDVIKVGRTLAKELTRDQSGLAIARAAGTYTVAEIDADEKPINSLRFMVKKDGIVSGWIFETKVLEIVERDGKPYKPEETRPLWQLVQKGDRVEVEGDPDISDGTYKVIEIEGDNDVSTNDGAAAILVDDGDGDNIWIYNRTVKAIVERDGKPFSADTDGQPAYLRAKSGDRVTVRGFTKLEDGDYEVTDVDEGDPSRLQVIGPDEQTWWIPNEMIVGVTASTGERIWRNVKLGDVIRITDSNGSKAGDYTVERTDDAFHGGSSALGIMLPGLRWIRNGAVVGIVSRDGQPYTGPGAVSASEPVWRLVKEGDQIRVAGVIGTPDGVHSVARVEPSEMGGPENSAVRLVRYGWIYNKRIQSIVERDGRPYTGPGSEPATDARPVWEQVLPGDKVRVEGSGTVSNGTYEVRGTDHALTSGADGVGVRVTGGWIRNNTVKAIVEREGKPFGGAASTAVTVLEKKPYELAEVGDRVTVEGSIWVGSGDYEVVRVQDSRSDSRVRVKRPNGTERWILNENIIAIASKAAASVPAVAEEPVYKLAKVGDWVRVETGHDHPAGTFKVTAISDLGINRVGVDYGGRNGGTWWIGNPLVREIVPGPGIPVSAVRGEFLIHVDVPTILANKANGTHAPVVAVRRLRKLDEQITARELAWDGPSRFVHHEFVKIEGTDIQNWIETDGPLTRWLDGQPLEVLTVDGQTPTPMYRPILGAFVIHIAAPVLMRNRREGRNDPVIAVRSAFTDWANDVVFCRKVEWSGPTRMVHRPTTPIPGTEGRGVAFVETDATLTLTVDGQPPIVLQAPQPRLLAA